MLHTNAGCSVPCLHFTSSTDPPRAGGVAVGPIRATFSRSRARGEWPHTSPDPRTYNSLDRRGESSTQKAETAGDGQLGQGHLLRRPKRVWSGGGAAKRVRRCCARPPPGPCGSADGPSTDTHRPPGGVGTRHAHGPTIGPTRRPPAGRPSRGVRCGACPHWAAATVAS